MERTDRNKAALQRANKSGSHLTPTIDSVRLFSGHKEIQIRHGDDIYRLRITSNGKLILNK